VVCARTLAPAVRGAQRKASGRLTRTGPRLSVHLGSTSLARRQPACTDTGALVPGPAGASAGPGMRAGIMSPAWWFCRASGSC